MLIDISSSFLGALAAILAGYFVWHLKKRSEPRYETLSFIKQKEIDVLMKIWSLLAYMSNTENPRSIIVWLKHGKEKTYYCKTANAAKYIDELPEIFYRQGCGLLLDGDIKKLLYEYRGILYGLLLSEKGQTDEIVIKNAEMTARMQEIYELLNSALRKQLENLKK